MTRRTAKRSSIPEPDGPAIVTPDHVRDRVLSKELGAPLGTSRLYGLGWLKKHKIINGSQYDAGRTLQDDYEISQQRGSNGGDGTGVRSSRRMGYDISQAAIDAKDRVNAALAVLPPELVTMTTRFLLPPDNEAERAITIEHVAAMEREDKRAVSFGIRVALSLLARHYGV